MSLSIRPERLKPYKDIARLLFKYGRADIISRSALEAASLGQVHRAALRDAETQTVAPPR